eukprot:jgi/Undpi1/8972/HiC_scaffold_26.g11433.m1
MADSPVLNSAKRKDLEDIALEDGTGSHKRLKRQLTQESDLKVYEQNIHETMKSMPGQRDRRKADYERVLTLFDSDSHARERRNKVFDFFNREVTKANCFQTREVYSVSQDLLSVLDEARESLELLVNWCDLCLPANEQAFAEAHRIKIQHFQARQTAYLVMTYHTTAQDYLAAGLQSVVSETGDINTQLDKRAQTLRSLFSTKDVLPENQEGWYRMHRDMLVHHETNAYLHVATTWEKVLEDYLLYYNYWKMNLKDNTIVFPNEGKGGNSDYFG